MIGTNNSGDNTPKEIVQGIVAIVVELRENLPETEILVLAIFPRGENDDDARRQVNMKVNEILAEGAKGREKIHYLDINQKFLEADRTLTREIMPDLLHPKEKGYAIWAEAIEPTLKKLMGE